jgi:hypothetical protein
MRYKLRSSTKGDTASSSSAPQSSSLSSGLGALTSSGCPTGATALTTASLLTNPVPSTSKYKAENFIEFLVDKEKFCRNDAMMADISSHQQPPEKKARMTVCRRKVVHKPHASKDPDIKKELLDSQQQLLYVVTSSTTIMCLGVDMVLYLAKYLDATSLISLYRSCHYFYDMLRHSGTFWKFVCQKEELANYECLVDKENEAEDFNKVGIVMGSNKSFKFLPYCGNNFSLIKKLRHVPFYIRKKYYSPKSKIEKIGIEDFFGRKLFFIEIIFYRVNIS